MTSLPGELDLHLIHEGRHEHLWSVLGAHPTSGATVFRVWAPAAQEVQVVCDATGWDGARHPMTRAGQGIWHTAVPEAGPGTRYAFRVRGADGVWTDRADPLATRAEGSPGTASVVWESSHTWGDDAWMAARAHRDPARQPLSVYEVHLASWRRHPDGGIYTWDEIADALVPYASDLGFTHVELMPVMAHPFGGSWGYHVTSYFATDARMGDPDGLKRLIDRCHVAGLGVILDWVPGHFATDPWALARFDGTALYEHPDPRRGWHAEWGSHIFDFGRHEVRNFLYANALFWLEEFHADGLRVDGVASMLYLDYARAAGEWVPNRHGGRENLEAVQFLQEMNATVHRRVPGAITIAEESTAWPGVTRPTSADGLGFDFKWNMGWMHDSLGYLRRDPVHRAHHHAEMTFSLVYAFAEHYVLPLSHDEVVHGKGSLLRKMPGDRWQQLATLRAYLALMWAHPGKQLLFMGGELGQEAEWAEARELDWWLLAHPEHAGVQALVRDLNRAYGATPALWADDTRPEGFTWIDANDAGRNTFAFVRRTAGEQPLVCVANFAAVPHEGYHLPLPAPGTWSEILNTDASSYTGSGIGNLGRVTARASDGSPGHPPGWPEGWPAHAEIVVPALATVWLRHDG